MEPTVKFGKHARTIDYSDGIGSLLFTFDFDITDNKSLILEHWARSTPRDPRYLLAFKRTKEFLELCGYSVRIFGG